MSPKNSPNVNISTSSINTNINKQSFASTVANSLIPKKDQALLIDIDDNIPHKDYIIAIGNLVQPSIRRLIFYLRPVYRNSSLVNNLIDNNPFITIQHQQFKLRKFFNPNKRIILSNVYPNIPPDIIANEFIKLNIPLCSPITLFRRQTFIQHDDLIKLPPTILINYEDTNYRIFLSDDSLTCYLCKAQDHIASYCLNQINSHNIMSQVNNDQPIANTPANAIKASGGISIFIKESYSSEEILVNTPLESVTISVQLKQKITICNLYLPNQSPFTEVDLKNIIQQLPPPFILLGDFNSHNKLWGCITTNTRGKIIESVIDSENLITLNNAKPTHFGTASAIDLTFTTPSFAPHLTWDTLSHPYGSDHLPIITKLTYRNTKDIQVGKPKWKLNTADWNLFTSLLEQKIDSIEFEKPKINNLNEVTQNFTNAILEIANLTIGQTIFSGRKPPVSWWNSHCNESIKSKKTAFNKFKRTKSQDDFIEFKKRRAQARRTIKDSKTTSWRAYTSSINSKANPKQIWNKIKAFKCINKYDNIQILKNENDTIYSEPSEIAMNLAPSF
ncbi:putative RNA-directed DNA polymerase [Aphis craccivora]|uniref:Putative RNA-directed DNA polymerase n=1 Tax=Aphis craccivora TaxID=307492 RepID=A0A6G0YH80_APHCR|nr:putative RNA-directed DNA polymerase [Aphis craccivora]